MPLTNVSPSLISIAICHLTEQIKKRRNVSSPEHNFCTMFPLHQGDELSFNISSNPNKISQDEILPPPPPPDAARSAANDIITNNNMVKTGQRRLASTDNNNTSYKNIKKTMMHRDNERQRRQEMATLYASLRSLLPLEFIKGKRSISDHMNEAVNYIKYMKKKTKELGAKRDELKKRSNLVMSSLNFQSDVISSSNVDYPSSSVVVRPCLGGLEIVVKNGLRALPFSRVLQILLEEGISVVNCVSTKVNESVFHTIQTEVDDPETSLNLEKLQQKLTLQFPSS